MDPEEQVRKWENTISNLKDGLYRPFIVSSTSVHNDLDKLHEVIKKCVLYSELTIVTTPPVVFVCPIGDTSGKAYTQWMSKPNGIFSNFKESANDRVFEKVLIEIPEMVSSKNEEWDGEEFYSCSPNKVWDFKDLYGNGNSIEVILNDPVISKVFGGERKQHEFSVVHSSLPSLDNISLSDLIKIREDEEDAFISLHRSLAKLTRSLTEYDSTEVLKEIILETDSQTRELEKRFKTLKRKHFRSLAEVTVGVSTIGLCAMLPDEISQALMAFLGGYQVNNFTQTLLKNWEEQDCLKNSDFYAAWKANDINHSKGSN